MKKKNKIMIPISAAELLDKIAILEVKEQRISGPEKLKNIKHELELLRGVFNEAIEQSDELNELLNKLRKLSVKGWDIEDRKRICERKNDFGQEFVEAARGAYKNNDERAALWQEINRLLKSDVVQEKSYEKY